ncbi:hypothetical protein D3C73_792180 [compost metagenome]
MVQRTPFFGQTDQQAGITHPVDLGGMVVAWRPEIADQLHRVGTQDRHGSRAFQWQGHGQVFAGGRELDVIELRTTHIAVQRNLRSIHPTRAADGHHCDQCLCKLHDFLLEAGHPLPGIGSAGRGGAASRRLVSTCGRAGGFAAQAA